MIGVARGRRRAAGRQRSITLPRARCDNGALAIRTLGYTMPITRRRRRGSPGGCPGSRCSGTGCRRAPSRISSSVGVGVVAQERGDRDDEARGAEPALQPVVVAERGLHRWTARRRAPRCPRSVVTSRAVGLHREHQARAHGLAVEQHRARAAHAVLAPEVRAGEAAPLAEEVGQRQAGLDRCPARPRR